MLLMTAVFCYAVFRFESGVDIPAVPLLMGRIEEETGWLAVEGAWLRRCRNVQLGNTTPQLKVHITQRSMSAAAASRSSKPS
jgi:hypothetical protein